MKLSDFDYDLPKELIAQTPSDQRDHSDLLIVNSQNDIVHTKFFHITDYLKPGDLMVFNDSRVIKARLQINKNDRKIDLYFTESIVSSDGSIIWSGFAKPAKKLQEGDRFLFDSHKIVIIKKLARGAVHIKLELDNLSVFQFLETYGFMPLPPYIKRSNPESLDEDRYQTVYNKYMGSVASTTAGLHFTDKLLAKIKAISIDITFITLHVGAGTFLPVRTENINDHEMHSESLYITLESASIINKAKAEGRRIIAVGTTSLRALESASTNGVVSTGEFETRLFIKPGFKFQIADMLLTNFHLPKSTLFILACAFAGKEEIVNAYQYAVNEKMRFFSYGDAMLLYRNHI